MYETFIEKEVKDQQHFETRKINNQNEAHSSKKLCLIQIYKKCMSIHFFSRQRFYEIFKRVNHCETCIDFKQNVFMS